MSATNAPPAARVGDEIKHKSQVAGLLGALAGAALSGVPFMLGPAGIFVGMLLMADDIGSPMVGQKSLSTKVQEGVEDAVQGFIESCFGEEKYGPIVIGANTVFINDKQAGVAVKPFAVACTRHAPLNQRIAEGSETVFIENFPAARKGDKTECGGVILEGSDNVIIGSGKIAYLEIKSEFHPLIDVVATIVPPSKAGVKSVLSGLGKLIKSPAASAKIGALVLGNAIKKGAGATKQAVGKAKYCISSNANCAKIAFRENKGKGIQRYKETAKKAIFGDPIDVMTGHLVEQRTDFSLGQTLPLTFTRTWARDWPQTIPAGLLGQYWADSFSQTAWVNEAAEYIQVFTEDGAVLQFGLPQGMSQTSNPYHPDYVLIRTGSATFLVKHRITGFCRHFEAVENGTTDAVNSEFDYPKLPIGRYRLSHFSDDYHNQARFIYQESNPTKPVRVEHSEGIQLTLRYHPSGYLHQIVRTDNQSTCLATYQQDSQGHLIESDAVQDFHLYYTYDEHSQLIEWSDRDKTRVNYRYNAQGQCVYSVGANGFYEVWLDYFDGYTQARNLKGTTTFYYDTALLTLTQVVSPTGKITRYAYDLYGNLLTQTLPKGEQLHFTYLEDTGLVKTFTDSLGAMWQYEYEIDDEHQDAYTLIKITDPLNRTWTKTTRFAENGAQQTACFTAPDGSTTEFTRNQYGLLTAIQTTEKQHQRQEHFQYDLRHRLIAQQDAEQRRLTLNYNDQDELTAFTAPKGNSWRYAYTRYGKLQHIQQPNQGGVNYRYDRHGNLLSYTDANQIEWTFRYGAFDLLIEKRDGEGHAWQYEYDKDSLKLTAVINPKGERYQYRYNADDQIDTETDFSGVQWHYGYDDNGNLATLTNSLGETNHYAYNANQQLTQISTEAGECCNYEYDAAGRLTELTTLDTALTFEYDVQDRVIKEVQQHGSQRTTLQWAYPDPQTKIRHIITETEGKTATLTTTYRYNRVGELVQLDLPAEQSGKSETSGQIPQLFCDYDANGNEIARYAPQGFQLRQQYDAMDNLIRQRAGNEPKHFFDKHALQATGIDAPTFAKLDRHYGYDLAQNTIKSHEREERLDFTLNRNGQITEVIDNHTLRESYRYDENGYLTQRHIGLARYGQLHDPLQTDYDKQPQIVQNTDIYQKGNRLNRLSDTVYRYDEAGRVISRTKHPNQRHERHETFVWDGFNQLITFNDKAQHQWHYKYDGLGRRIEKYSERDNTTTKYIWDGDQLALTQTFKQDKLIHQRHSVFHGWELLAQQDSYQDKHTTHYAVSQPNGKILGLFTPEGELAWKAEKRTLWGICFDWYQFKYPNPLDPEMLFAGQWLNQESGLAYNRFRYYDPETGNYLCLDPIGLAGGETPYSYVFNPIDWLDTLGLHLNSNKSKGNFGIYEIKINGEVYKYGKADLNRVTKSSGLPTRLHQQVRKLGNLYGKQNVEPRVIEKGLKTTELAKQMETSKLDSFYRKYGKVPLGNQKSYKPNLEPVVKKCKR